MKDPRFVESGKRGAIKRWGIPKTARLDGLDEDARMKVHALVERLRRQSALT